MLSAQGWCCMEVPVLGNPGFKEIWVCLLLDAPCGTLLPICVCPQLESKFSTWGNEGHRRGCWFSASSWSTQRPCTKQVDQPRNEQVHGSHHCLRGEEKIHMSSSCLFLPPMISLEELSWGRRNFDIKSSPQFMAFFLAKVAGERFCLLLVALLRLLHWIFRSAFLAV